jgi:hypothetical protein
MEELRPSMEAKIKVLLKTDSPSAATALLPSLPTIARSINAIDRVEPCARLMGNASLRIVLIRSDVESIGRTCAARAA